MSLEHEKDPGWQYLKRSREQQLADQSRPYDSKKNVWIPDAEEGYIEGVIKGPGPKADTVIVTAGGKDVTLKKDIVQEVNPPKFEKTEDMSNLTFLNDASVLWNLRSRYAAMLIYTYSGLFCVVINPYKRLPIYTDSVARMFMGKRRTEMPPHLFAVSDQAYRYMLQDHENQSMLITGESGAGKTENTKKVICYFATVGASQKAALKEGEKEVTLEDQIVQTNPVLEAFGNAKTVRNNNSSRFGKFIRIHFNKHGTLASCDIEHYLLEKSRVIRQAPGERCYHIFYQIYSDFKPQLRDELLLNHPISNYWFVAQAELLIDGIDDTEEFQLTDEAFDVLKFSPTEKMDCYRLMSAHMHMGNMKFKQRPREEQAEPDGQDEAERACNMYGIDVDQFLKALVSPRVKVGTEWVSKGQNVDQVHWAIGAMAKGLYARVFHWLVKKCNLTLDQKGIDRDYFIGVLDIAGFEIFDFNSFEQLWINFVNEKLQQFFNHHMFVLEQEEYAREGIQWTFIDFGLDLQACIELIEKPLGIISMLDEECIVPKATDMTLAQKLTDQHLGKHPNFEKPKPPKGKQGEAHFAMRHYAGTVRYNVLNWLEKNKDPLNDTVVSVMKASKKNDLLVEIWQDYTTQEEAAAAAKAGGGRKGGKSGSFMTVSMMYRESLNKLMTMLHKTHPHFIRCIIPNEKKQSGMIDAALVLNQLTCNGVLEGIRICRKGFPNRTQHPDFVQRYAILAAKEAKSSDDMKTCAGAILQALINQKQLNDEQFRIGHTKVFFKAGVVAHIEDLRDDKLNQIITGFQSAIRWYTATADAGARRKQLNSYIILQRNIRSWCVLRTWDWFLLFGKLRPQLKCGKMAEEMIKMAEEQKVLEAEAKKAESARKSQEEAYAKLSAERSKLLEALELTQGGSAAIEEKLTRLNSARQEVEKSLNDANDRLSEHEEKNADLEKQRRKAQQEVENLKKSIEAVDGNLAKSLEEKAAKENQIHSLQDEMNSQDETIGKINKEKKLLEENNRQLVDDLQAEEAKQAQANRLRGKLEQTLDEMEEAVEREKRIRAETEKSKRKVEGELKGAQETIDELSAIKLETDASLKKKEADIHALGVRIEDEQALANRLTRQSKENAQRIIEIEDELEHERQSRSKADRARAELQRELDELNERLDEQNKQLEIQQDNNKKKDSEIIKFRRDLDEKNMANEDQMAMIRRKNNDQISALTNTLDALQKSKAKIEKEKGVLQKELDDINAQVDQETKSRVEQERLAKQYEIQVAELQQKVDEQSRQIGEYTSTKGRLSNDNSDLARQVEELEIHLATINRAKTAFSSQLVEAKKAAEDELHERQEFHAACKNLEHELDQCHELLEEQINGKDDIQRQLSRINSEISQWKARYEGEGLVGSEELEELKRKQMNRVMDLQEALSAAQNKVISLEKAKGKLLAETEDARSDVDRHLTVIASLEKKQRAFDKIVDDWKRKVDDIQKEIDATTRDSRNTSTEVFKLRSSMDNLSEQIETLRRENKIFSQEIRDINEQITQGGRTYQEVHKSVRRLEQEKDELQHALDEAEAALEAEESKVLRLQIEVQQIRSEIEKRIQEKEEEFENTRKNHQRALESIQASLETEAKSKAELARAKKKLETDINQLEIALDHANKANVDAQKNLKKLFDQVKELQGQVDDEQRRREEIRENYLAAEKRLAIALSESEDLAHRIEASDKHKKQLEIEQAELKSSNTELIGNNAALSAMKRKVENEVQIARNELDEYLNELKASEERARKAAADADRLAEEVRQEQEHAVHVDRQRKSLELNAKELQAKIDDAERAMIQFGAKALAKVEDRVRSLEAELHSEQRRHQESIKGYTKQERRARELQFQVEEDKKAFDRLQENVEKLQQKIRVQKRQIEEAEEVATQNLSKFRQIQLALENAEERAEVAENSLVRMRGQVVRSATNK
ncbi:Myosin-1 [Caenorhabditis elegans]|uniref:Myosin-1 n=1 Tax=Caenorhabditis elegans TaxID=6239 RepID=MYO1_CAEEL|nr:Myosin-1 [Caenorhabditis elegans]P02567.3 RecName: Full=Myosin-1; AltName: Full=Myosin heavy chain D; Short=MHC D [Caenorhabditis elegans]CAA95848.1 Myosin-1 [Caenorhabditis elegans]|eukprot:NP_492053.1 Myosin-1 [Caenorhabditis elegans]